MTYDQGKMLKTNQISIEQTNHLGCVTGEMHRLLNDGALIAKDKPLFILPSKEERITHWDKLAQKMKEDRNLEMLDLLKLHQKATSLMDMNLLTTVETWAHRDLWTDNILFKENGMSAILDFDRMHYDYPEMGIARALLSFCLVEDHFDTLLWLANQVLFEKGEYVWNSKLNV